MEKPLGLAEVFSSNCTAAFSILFFPCFLSFASFFLLPSEISSVMEEGREQGMMRVMMLWFFSPFCSLGADLHLSCSQDWVNFLLVPGHALNVTAAGVRIHLELVTPPSAGISPWKGGSGLGTAQGGLGCPRNSWGWHSELWAGDKVGTRHSWDWMILELFPNNSVEG